MRVRDELELTIVNLRQLQERTNNPRQYGAFIALARGIAELETALDYVKETDGWFSSEEDVAEMAALDGSAYDGK